MSWDGDQSRNTKPIARALVYAPDNRNATLTDDRGAPSNSNSAAEKIGPTCLLGHRYGRMRKVQQWYARECATGRFFCAKAGISYGTDWRSIPETGSERAAIVITLEPELITGHVQIAGCGPPTESVQMYGRNLKGARRWVQRTELRPGPGDPVSALAAGTYKTFHPGANERDPRYSIRGTNFMSSAVFFRMPRFFRCTPFDWRRVATVQANTLPARAGIFTG